MTAAAFPPMPGPADDDPETARASLDVVLRMEAALGASSNTMGEHFHEDFRWMGNRGCGTKHGLDAFRRDWQLPFRAAFTERDYRTARFIAQGEWVSCFGHIEATHSGPFMGIPATGRRSIMRWTNRRNPRKRPISRRKISSGMRMARRHTHQ